MQEQLGDNDSLMCSIHIEGDSVIAERFTKTLKGNINKNMTASDSNSYLSYLNKLVDQYKNAYDHSISKNLLILIFLLCLNKIKQILKLLNLKLVIESELQTIIIILVNATLKID